MDENEDDGIDVVGLAANINSCVCAVISSCLNTYIIAAVLKSRVKAKLGLYKWLMAAVSTFEIVYSILSAIGCPTIAADSETSSVLFVKGGFSMPFNAGLVLLLLWIVLLCVSMITSPCLFFFRYIQVCRRHWIIIHGARVLYIFIIPVFLSASAACMLVVAAFPSAEDIEDFDYVAYYINSNGHKPFFVASLIPRRTEVIIRSRVLIAACINLVFNLICGMLAMVLCTICMLAAVRKATSSSKSMRLQNQLLKLLIVQFLIPFICIQVPFCTCCLGPLVHLEITGTDTGSLADYLPFLFAWSPALNPAAVLYFVRDLWSPLRSFIFPSRVETVAVSKVSTTQKQLTMKGQY